MRAKEWVALVPLFVMVFCSKGFAQGPNLIKDDIQEDMSAVKRDLAVLLAQQRQMIDQLNELKRVLPAAGRPRPQAPSTLDVHGQIFRGDGAARVAIIEYADFECPYCGQYERNTSSQILEKYIKTAKVKLFYRDLPLPEHPHALSATRAAYCAGEQGKYWEMHDSLFANQLALSDPALLGRAKTVALDTNKFSECFSSNRYSDELRKSVDEAQRMGIDGTPTFFIGTIRPDGNIVNINKRIVGAHPFEVFQSALDEVLASRSQETVSAH
jgi:protein-disulfide isomerase